MKETENQCSSTDNTPFKKHKIKQSSFKIKQSSFISADLMNNQCLTIIYKCPKVQFWNFKTLGMWITSCKGVKQYTYTDWWGKLHSSWDTINYNALARTIGAQISAL